MLLLVSALRKPMLPAARPAVARAPVANEPPATTFAADRLDGGQQGLTVHAAQDCHGLTGLQVDHATVIEFQDGRAAGAGDEAHAAHDGVACRGGAARCASRHGDEALHVVDGPEPALCLGRMRSRQRAPAGLQ